MKSPKFYLPALALFVLASVLAYGQAPRTWVSGVRDDANPCSRTAPCKTWAGAISKTAQGGEIDALDPGGFGALTITKSITLDGGGGQVASTLVAGTDGIVVAAGASDVVILRNIRITGQAQGNNPGLNGIKLLSGKFLSIENCDVFGFSQNGISLTSNQSSNVQVKNTTSTDNGGKGLFASTTSGTIRVSVDSSYFSNNGHGVWADENSFVTVSRSVADNNTGIGFIAQGNGGSATMDVTSSITTGNGVGIQTGGGPNASQVFVNGTYVGSNLAGLVNGLNGTSDSYGTGTNPFKDTGSFNGAAQPIK